MESLTSRQLETLMQIKDQKLLVYEEFKEYFSMVPQSTCNVTYPTDIVEALIEKGFLKQVGTIGITAYDVTV